MPSFNPSDDDVVFLVVSACKGALETAKRCWKLVEQGNRVNVVATPTAAKWMDSNEIESITGWPVRSEMRMPHEPTFTPLAGRVLATPVSLNTLTKWAAGHADNLAIGLLCEALGAGLPTEAEIQMSVEFANQPATQPAIETLIRSGVGVRTSPGGYNLDDLIQNSQNMKTQNV